MTNDDITVRELQRHQPWTVPYSKELERSIYAMPHLYATHAVLHAIKSLGKIAAVFEDIDHRGGGIKDIEVNTVRAMSADLFTITLRLANLCKFDLMSALRERVREKNGCDVVPDVCQKCGRGAA